jgi:transcription initiation factor IIE alpha subunit
MTTEDTKPLHFLEVYGCDNEHEYYFCGLGNIRPFLCPQCKTMLQLVSKTEVPERNHLEQPKSAVKETLAEIISLDPKRPRRKKKQAAEGE